MGVNPPSSTCGAKLVRTRLRMGPEAYAAMGYHVDISSATYYHLELGPTTWANVLQHNNVFVPWKEEKQLEN